MAGPCCPSAVLAQVLVQIQELTWCEKKVEEGGIRASSAGSCLGGMSSPCHASAHVQASGERAARQEQQLEVMQAQNAGLKSCLQTRTASAGYLGCDLPPGSQVAHGSEWGW